MMKQIWTKAVGSGVRTGVEELAPAEEMEFCSQKQT